MTRKEARDVSMKILYQYDLASSSLGHDFLNYIKDYNLGEQLEYVKSIFESYLVHKDEINELINNYSKNWDINRIAKIDLAILRLSTIEIKYLSDIPKAVSINEAVNLAKKYGTDDSKAFINAVLANI